MENYPEITADTHLCFIVGLIDSYSGGLNLKNGILQSFAYPSTVRTKAVTELAVKYILEYFDIIQERSDLEVIANSAGAVLKSSHLCNRIMSVQAVSKFLIHDYFEHSEILFQKVKNKDYQNLSVTGNIQRINFLRGVFLRNYINGELVFWNDYEKAICTHRVLTRFVDDGIHIKMNSYFNSPHTVFIKLVGLGSENVLYQIINDPAYKLDFELHF